MTFEKYLPNKKPKKQVSAIYLRPDKDVCEWLMELATKHNVSVNKLVNALLKAEKEKK